MVVLQVEKVTKTWDNNTNILSEVDLNITSGESLAIVGKSGSGKSTFLQIVGLLDQPTSGRIYIEDQDCTKLSDNQKTFIRRHKIGFVYQFHHLLAEFSVIENLVIPQLICGTDEENARKKALGYLERFGLGHKTDSFINTLSGGEKQRIAIIRAIINNPKLIIADEPTGNLDNHNSLIAFKLLQEVVSETNASLIIATHCLELSKMCTKTLSLENGALTQVKQV